VGQKIAGKSSDLSAATGVANVEIMKMAVIANPFTKINKSSALIFFLHVDLGFVE
jgi:hypothetical protein